MRIVGADRAGGAPPSRGGVSDLPTTDAGGAPGETPRGRAEPDEPTSGTEADLGVGPEDRGDATGPAEPMLPHWTEAPTGQIPAILSRREHGEDDDPWAALPKPSWREGRADWARAEAIAPDMEAEAGGRSGLLRERGTTDRQPWSFELGRTATSAFEEGDGADGAYGEDRVSDAAGSGSSERTPPRDRRRGARRHDDLEGAAPYGTAAPGRAGAVHAAREAPADTSAAHRREPWPAEDDAFEARAGEKTSILRLADISAAAAARGHEEEDHATAEGAITADTEERQEDHEPVGAKKGRLGRAPGARRGSARHAHPPSGVPAAGVPAAGVPAAGVPAAGMPEPGMPESRRPRPASSGARGADAASAMRRGEDPVSARTGRNITAAVLSGIAIGAVVLIAFSFGTVSSMVVVTLVLSLAAVEAFGAFRRAGYRPATLLGLVAVAGLIVATYNKTTEALPIVLVLLVAGTFFWHLIGVDRRAEPVRSISATLLVFCWVGVFGSFAALLLAPSIFPHRTGIAYLLGALIAAVAYDIGALAAGAWMGRHPLSAVSPGKTWEGLIGGAIVSIVVSVGAIHLIHPWTLAETVGLGVIVAVVSPIGDLCESLVKRHLGLKDMGRILPGHGGLLDRIDGLLFVLPATYYLVRAFH